MPTPVEFPLLGEPLSIELANTSYGTGSSAIDFLSDRALADSWVEQAAGNERVDDLARLRELRDAVRRLVSAQADGRPLPRHAVHCVNRHAAEGDAAAELRVRADGEALATIAFRGPAALRASLATSCIEVLTGPHPVKRCEGVGCSLFFVQQHGRRRFCHESCSHRARQLRYRRMP